jgi:hypothetical protein
MYNSPGCGKKKTAYKSNPTWSIPGGLPSCDSAPASLLAYTTTNKVLKRVALSLVWKELSW